MVGNLHGGVVGGLPVGDRLEVFFQDDLAVKFAQEVFHQDAYGKGQAADFGDAFGFKLVDVVIFVGLAVDGEFFQAVFFFHWAPRLGFRVIGFLGLSGLPCHGVEVTAKPGGFVWFYLQILSISIDLTSILIWDRMCFFYNIIDGLFVHGEF